MFLPPIIYHISTLTRKSKFRFKKIAKDKDWNLSFQLLLDVRQYHWIVPIPPVQTYPEGSASKFQAKLGGFGGLAEVRSQGN